MEKRIIEVPISVYPNEEQKKQLINLFDASDIAYNFALSRALQEYQLSGGVFKYDPLIMMDYLKQTFSSNPMYPNITDPMFVNQDVIMYSIYKVEQDMKHCLSIGAIPTERHNFMNPYRSYTVWLTQMSPSKLIDQNFIYIFGLNSYVGLIDSSQNINNIVNPFNKIIGMSVIKNYEAYSVILIIEQLILEAVYEDKSNKVGIYLNNNDYTTIALSNGYSYTLPPEIGATVYKLTALFNEVDKRKEQGIGCDSQLKRIDKYTSLLQKQIPIWHQRVAYDLITQFSTIVVENQFKTASTRIVFGEREIRVAGWLQFLTKLYDIKRNLNLPSKIIKVTKDDKVLTICSICGHELLYPGQFFEQWHCPACGIQHKTYNNAARNILLKS